MESWVSDPHKRKAVKIVLTRAVSSRRKVCSSLGARADVDISGPSGRSGQVRKTDEPVGLHETAHPENF